MPGRRRRSPARWVAAALIAAGAHALVAWVLFFYGLLDLLKPSPPPPTGGAAGAVASRDPSKDDRPIEIQSLVDELAAPDERTDEEKRAEEKKKEEEDKRDPDGQVVDIARPPLEERPEHAKFLAEYDSKVEHETKGRLGHDRAGAPVEVVGGERASERRPEQPLPPGVSMTRPGLPGRAPSLRVHQAPGLHGQDGTAEELTDDGNERRPGAPGAPAHPLIGGEGGLPGQRGAPRPNLQPSQEILQRAIGRGTGSPDALGDIDDGESTALNAKKFKYASFFNRVKRAVAEEWHPDVVYLRHDPTGNVYGTKDRVTVLRVHLKPDGQLHSVSMLQASGVEFLDDEAIDAFRRAQPFVNPPTQLVDADGLIHFNFGFIFELSGHTSFKVFKYQ